MRRTTKAEQIEYAKHRATELAQTGRFVDWLTIEFHLRFEEGCPRVQAALSDQHIREELNRLCWEARSSNLPTSR